MAFDQYITNPYLRSLAILFAVFILLRVIIFVIERVVLALTKKTKTDIDDIFIKKSSKPFTILVGLIGLRIAIEELPLNQSAETIISSIIFSLMTIVVAFIIYYFIDLFLVIGLRRALKGTNFEAEESVAGLANSVMKAILAVSVFLFILSIWGVEIGPFLAGLGIAGIAVALALQPTLANVFSGISMLLDKTIKAGDLIYLDQQTKGKIQRVGLRSTKILTFDNELLIVPNTKLAETTIQNVAQPEPKARVVIPFSVAYGTDINKVKEIILKEISQIKNSLKKPTPTVRFIAMGTSSLDLKAYFYVDTFEHRFASIDEANTRIYNILRKKKIEIPFPQLDVHLKKK